MTKCNKGGLTCSYCVATQYDNSLYVNNTWELWFISSVCLVLYVYSIPGMYGGGAQSCNKVRLHFEKVYCWSNTIIREKTSHDFKTANMWLLWPSAPPVLVALGHTYTQEAVSMYTVILIISSIVQFKKHKRLCAGWGHGWTWKTQEKKVFIEFMIKCKIAFSNISTWNIPCITVLIAGRKVKIRD